MSIYPEKPKKKYIYIYIESARTSLDYPFNFSKKQKYENAVDITAKSCSERFWNVYETLSTAGF